MTGDKKLMTIGYFMRSIYSAIVLSSFISGLAFLIVSFNGSLSFSSIFEAAMFGLAVCVASLSAFYGFLQRGIIEECPHESPKKIKPTDEPK